MSKTGAMFLEQQEDKDAVIAELLAALEMVRFNWAGHAEQCAFVQMGGTYREERFVCDCDWPNVRAQIDAAIAKATP